MKKTAKLGIAALILFVGSNLTYAAQPGYYVGAGLGKSKLETHNQNLADGIQDLQSSSSSKKIGGLGGRIFGGYNFSQYIGVEGGYSRYAKSNYKSNMKAVTGETANASLDYSLYALDLVGKAYLPIGGTGVNIYGLGGLAYVSNTAEAKASVDNNVILKTSPTTRKFRPKYGVGVSYDIPNTRVTTNLEYSRIQGLGNVQTNLRAIPAADMTTLNVSYNFG